MSYGNYAPFYRPNFYNQPIQPNMSVDPQPQFVPQFNSSPSNDMTWVLNENEATSFPVAMNNTVVLWDKNNPTIYIKSVNAQGIPSMRILDFTERTSPEVSANEKNHICKCGEKFATKEQVEELQKRINEITEKCEELTSVEKTKNNKKTKDGEE